MAQLRYLALVVWLTLSGPASAEWRADVLTAPGRVTALELAAGLTPERIEIMCLMNMHYDSHGLVGNPNVLRWILGREPTRFADFIVNELPMK